MHKVRRCGSWDERLGNAALPPRNEYAWQSRIDIPCRLLGCNPHGYGYKSDDHRRHTSRLIIGEWLLGEGETGVRCKSKPMQEMHPSLEMCSDLRVGTRTRYSPMCRSRTPL